MDLMLSKLGRNSKRFLEDRRDFLFWLLTSHGSGSDPSVPSFLINENKEYILIGGDRIIVRDARS